MIDDIHFTKNRKLRKSVGHHVQHSTLKRFKDIQIQGQVVVAVLIKYRVYSERQK